MLTGDELEQLRFYAANEGSGPALEHMSHRGFPIIQIGFWGPLCEDQDQEEDTERAIFESRSGCLFSLAACWTKSKNPNIQGGKEGEVYQNGVEVKDVMPERPSFTHCEIRFANGFVVSIHESNRVQKSIGGPVESIPGTVHCRKRDLDTRNYWFIELGVGVAEHAAMFRAACRIAAAKTPFNSRGMLLNFVWPFKYFPFEACGQSYFCSELVTALLIEGNVIRLDNPLHPSTTSPNDLWDLMVAHPDSYWSYNRNSKPLIEQVGDLIKPIVPGKLTNDGKLKVGQ